MNEPIDPAYIEALKKMTPEQSLQAMCDMWHLCRRRLAEELRKANPDWYDDVIERDVRIRFLGGSLGEFAFLETEVQRQVMSKHWDGFAGGTAA